MPSKPAIRRFISWVENTISHSLQKGTERFVYTLQLDLEDNKTVTGALVYSNKPEAEAEE